MSLAALEGRSQSQTDFEDFVGLLSRAAEWRRKSLPEIDRPQGYLLLLFLLKHKEEPRPIGDFYQLSHLSEPTMRKAIKAFTMRDLAVMVFDDSDTRCRFIRGTPKLTTLAEEYLRLLAELGTGRSEAHPASSSSSG